MEQGSQEVLEQEIDQRWQDLQLAEEARAARNFLGRFLQKRRREILAEFQRLDSLDREALLMGALAVKSALGAIDALGLDLEHTIKRGDDARFALPRLRSELAQTVNTEEAK